MTNALRKLCFLIAGVIHLLPMPGLAGPAALERLYGVQIDSSDLAILMQHRALLFALLGVLLIVAAFRRRWQLPALIAGVISTVGFVVLALLADGYGPALQRVVVADVVAIACLLTAGVTMATARGARAKRGN